MDPHQFLLDRWQIRAIQEEYNRLTNHMLDTMMLVCYDRWEYPIELYKWEDDGGSIN